MKLVVRCARATPAGGGSGAVVELAVSGTGLGILEEDQELISSSFQQVDGSMTRHYGGNGLGLAICRELTELLGGSITVHSEHGAGSTFVVRVPTGHERNGQASRLA